MVPRMTTKQIIIKIAGDLFMDKGYKSSSTREIAEMAGITQPNLYHHFKTKEDIYMAVLEDLSLEVRGKLDALVDENELTLVDNLKRILNYLRMKHPMNFSIMSHDMTYEISSENHHHLYKIWQDSYLAPLVRLFDRYLQTDKTPYSSDQLARHYYATITPFIQRESGFYKEISSEQVIELFVYGILSPKEESS